MDIAPNFDGLLGQTSRTFALGIRLLPAPLRHEVTLAYLLFRVADTFEDAELWTPAQRVYALADFQIRLRRAVHTPPGAEGYPWAGHAPTAHAGCVALLAQLTDLLQAFHELPAEARAIVAHHVDRTVAGMVAYQTRGGRPDAIVVEDTEDLRRYCYVVAGIVGELLTDLFAHRLAGKLDPAAVAELRRHAAAFGEGLQLVNVLKDAAADAAEGRSFLPEGTDRGGLFALARRDLDAADAYVRVLRRSSAPRGVVGFCWLPVRLARAALDRVERQGAGAKITRAEVAAHLHAVTSAAAGA